MSIDESMSAWELTGIQHAGAQNQAMANVNPRQDAPWPKGITEDLASDTNLVVRDDTRLIFSEKQSAEVWRKRMNREALASAERWDLREVRIVRKGGRLAEAMEDAGITPIACGDFYVIDTDFFKNGLALEMAMALRKRIEALEQSK